MAIQNFCWTNLCLVNVSFSGSDKDFADGKKKPYKIPGNKYSEQ